VGTVFGPIIGAAIFIPITIALRGWLGTSVTGLYMIIYGVILIIIMLYMPDGIYGKIKNRLTAAGPANS
jgi:branched-chain amino acid transport system permease protein